MRTLSNSWLFLKREVEVETKLKEVTPEQFNHMLAEKIDAATGAGKYTQKVGKHGSPCIERKRSPVQVLAFERDTPSEGSVNNAPLCSLMLGFDKWL